MRWGSAASSPACVTAAARGAPRSKGCRSSSSSSPRTRRRSGGRSWSSRISKRLWAPLALLAVLVALVLDVLNRYEPIGIDFHTYLAAAVVGLQHGWSYIYDQDLV